MNKKLLYTLIVVLGFTFSCEDEYEAPGYFSDVAWATNLTYGTSTDRNEGEWLSFIDLSVNATSHTWTIEEGNAFLKKGFTDSDSLPQFIDPSMGLSTEKIQINVLFNNPGVNKIRLRNTFKEKVTWNGSKPISAVYDKKEGEWVVDTCLEVYVYAKIKPALKVYKDEALTKLICSVDADTEVNLSDSASWETVTLEAGEKLYFVDETEIGEPTARSWSFKGSKNTSSTDKIAVASFFTQGQFKGMTLKSLREKPFPEANAIKYIPLKVEVIKSSQPFSSDGVINELADETIKIGVTGELETVPQSQAMKFTVHVKNETGFNQNIDVISVMRDPKDFTGLLLKLSQPIYNSDVITVSYATTADEVEPIVSVDGRVLESFEATPVNMYFVVPVCEQPDQMSFEIAEPATKGGADGWWTPQPDNFFRSETRARFGKASLECKIDVKGANFDPAIETDNTGLPNALRFEAGTYKFRMHIYIPSECNTGLKTLFNNVTIPWTSVQYDISSIERDKWVAIDSKVLTFNDDIDCKLILKINNTAALSDEVHFWVDQFEILPIELRP